MQEPFQDMVDRKRSNRMRAIDSLPPAIRELVHVYGYVSVKTLMDCGVVKPNQIRHCIERILDEFSPTRGSFSIQGVRKHIETGEIFSGRHAEKSSETSEGE